MYETVKNIIRKPYNKYLITALAFVVWVAYFDHNDWYTQKAREKELQDVDESISYLRSEIVRMRSVKEGIEQNEEVLEKFARENYHMKRPNEDVYVFQ